jgi:hypothetical protein
VIVEVLYILSILLGGSALVRSLGIKNWWALPALGFIAGLSIFITVGTVQAITPLTTNPLLTIFLTAGPPLALWVSRLVRGYDVNVNWHTWLTIILAVILAVVFFREANLVNWHTDSFRYIMASTLIATDNYDVVSTNLASKRMLAVPLMHAPANLIGDWYARSVTPLLSASMLIAMAWFVWEGLRKKFNKRVIITFIALGLLLLVSTNRFVFHALYLNGHLLFGALVLIIAGCSWLMATNKELPKKALLTLQLLAIPALVVTRPEASIVAGLAVLPLLMSGIVSWGYKAALLGVLGLSMIVWQGFVATIYAESGASAPFSVYGLLLAGVGAIILIPLLRLKQISKYTKIILVSAEVGLWLALAILASRDIDTLVNSINATIQNVALGSGSWGVAFIALFVLSTGLFLFVKMPNQVYLRFAVTTFLPLVFLLAFLREGAYREGNGDSLNRMWMQIIPLAVVYITAAMIAGEWRFKLSGVKRRLKILTIGK